MGFVPIVVALLGLIVLYSVFTYNKIKPLKAAVTRVIDQMSEVSRKRKMLIINYDQENAGSPLAKAAAELKKTSTDRFQSYKKEESLLATTTDGANSVADTKVKSEILSLNDQQKELIKKLQNTSNTYNSFIKKAPASTVASIFGFRPF
ncbi:MAG: hypothetical protein HEP71_32600 [Roseivirga sp.]|nr:hypothetical protein [Roseivirga sp.]